MNLVLQAQQKRAPKALDFQANASRLQEELKEAKDQLSLLEKEKSEVVEELKEARKISEDTFDKLSEALADQKRLEEIIEIEKFRAIEMEQAGIESADKQHKEWNKEIQELRTQQASDVNALLTTTEELQRLKVELAEVSDAKNQAIDQANASAKETQAYHENTEALTSEIASLKALLDSKIEAASDSGDMVLGLKSEVELLKLELDRSTTSTEKLEQNIEKLNIEISESKMAQAYSNNLVKEWKQQVEELELKVQELNAKEISVSESLNSVRIKLQETELESKRREESLTEHVTQAEAAVEELQTELKASKEAEGNAVKLIEEWKQKAKELEKQTEEANATEKTALDSLSAVKIQLDETRGLLQESNKKVTNFAKKIDENVAANEQLNVELEASKMSEAYANNLVDEWKQKVEELEDRVEEANRSEKAMKESLNSATKELETSRGSLKEAEAEINVLEEKVGLLEMSFERTRGDHRLAENRAATAEADAFEMAKMIETLKIQLETAQEEKLQALDNEKLTASNVQALLEEKNKLINDLENSKYEEEKSKKAMESLAAALHEVSAEAREAKEKFLARQAEHETYESQIDDLKCILKETNEKYKTMLDEARHEVDDLMIAIQKSEKGFKDSKTEWEVSKSELVNSAHQTEDEKLALENEIKRLTNVIKEFEEGGTTTENEKTQLIEKLKAAESEVIYMQGVLGEAKAESMKLKETLLENESEMHEIIEENGNLRTRETAALEKVKELSKLLEQSAAKQKNEVTSREPLENGIPKPIQSPEASEHLTDDEAVLTGSMLFQNMNGDLKKDEESAAVETDEKDYSPEKSLEESIDEEMIDIGEISFDKRNGESIAVVTDNNIISPTRQQKKKKAMLGRFGSLLKKNSSKNQKS